MRAAKKGEHWTTTHKGKPSRIVKTRRYPNLEKARAAKRAHAEARSDRKMISGEIASDAQISVVIKGKGISTQVNGTYFGVGVILGRLFGFRSENGK